MKILFINGSPNAKGNTAILAKQLLRDHIYETLALIDYRINSYGQTLPGDQLDIIINKIRDADIVIIGSPLYWHNICGSVRNMLDRFYNTVPQGSFLGKKLFFVFQGASPEKWMLKGGEYTIQRFAKLYAMKYEGMVTTTDDVKRLSDKI